MSGLIGVISIPFALLFLSWWAVVEGDEFSPDTFQTRHFRYFRIPVIGIPLTQRAIEDSSSVFQQELRSDGYIPPPATKTGRWDLIRDNWKKGTSPDFDAAILDTYLKMSSDGHDEFWSNWNAGHPGRAAVFWKVIAELARANQYVLMPDLFRLAIDFPEAKKGEPDSFAEKLHKLASQLLIDQAARFRQSGDSATATELESLAVSIADSEITASPVKPPADGPQNESAESADR